MSFCRVYGCRFNSYHTTVFHQCGKCKMFGHGQVECDDLDKKNVLKSFYNERMPHYLFCTVTGCKKYDTHRTEGHCCCYCGKKSSHLHNCPENIMPILSDPVFCGVDPRDVALQQNLKNQTYTDFYGGMGSTWYVRNNLGNLEYLLMDADSWGQYGENTSYVPKYVAFIDGYTYVPFNPISNYMIS